MVDLVQRQSRLAFSVTKSEPPQTASERGGNNLEGVKGFLRKAKRFVRNALPSPPPRDLRWLILQVMNPDSPEAWRVP